jgi:hypothetical protein
MIEGLGDAQDFAVGVCRHPAAGGGFGAEKMTVVVHVGP